MTTQDWIIIAAGWIALAAVVAGLMWDRRSDSRRLDRHRADLNNHARRLVLVEDRPGATSVGQPMASVTGTHRAIGRPPATGGVISASSAYRVREDGCDLFAPSRAVRATLADADPTLRLALPPALTDIESVLHQAGRALTATEMATKLDRKPWDCLPELEWLLKAGRIQTVPGHTAGRTAYRLADQTERMPHGMSVLPGVVR